MALRLASLLLLCAACGSPSEDRQVEATYNDATGKLSRLTLNTEADGKPNITSYVDGSKFIRIEIDANEDGKTDRWEYYGTNQKIVRVGLSRANDGKEDAWVFPDATGAPSRIEVSTRRDGKVNRIEFYERGALARAEEDTDTDGRVDKWETYENEALVSVSFDTSRSGKPTTTINYPR